jgi:hypothetical protein
VLTNHGASVTHRIARGQVAAAQAAEAAATAEARRLAGVAAAAEAARRAAEAEAAWVVEQACVDHFLHGPNRGGG